MAGPGGVAARWVVRSPRIAQGTFRGQLNGLTRVVAIAALVGAGFAPGGCANLTSPARSHELGPGAYWLDYSADRRGSVVLPAGEHRIVCAEPPPDVAQQQVARLVASIERGDIQGGVTGELLSEVVQLAGRTQTVLVLRESLYRLCEQNAAGTLTREDVRAMYADVLRAVESIAAADAAREVRQATKALGEADPSTREMIKEFLAGNSREDSEND